jgi:hypothetical protein
MAASEATKLSTEQYYKDYESRRGVDRNDILRNPEVLFQILAADASLISALRYIRPDPIRAKVLGFWLRGRSELAVVPKIGLRTL